MPALTYLGREAKINDEGHLVTNSVMEQRASHRAKVHKDVYFWTANIGTPGADTNLIWIKNNMPGKVLRLDLIEIYSSAVCEIETFIGSGSTTGGDAVTGRNTYLGQPNDVGAVCRSQNTNVDAGSGLTIMSNIRLGVATEMTMKLAGVLTIPYSYEFAINIITDSLANVKVNMIGYFEDNGDSFE